MAMSNEEPKINKNRQKKMDTVARLSDKFGKAKAIVFTNYQGLTHKQIESLKKELKKAESEFVVAKNSLLTRAIDEKHKLEGEHELEGQTGTLFLYNDVLTPLKALAKTIKELNLPNVKFGVMDGDFISGEQILKLSTLPSREVLLAQLVFTLHTPISGLHRALNWNLQKLVMTLNAISQNKPAQAVDAPAKEPTIEPIKPVVEQTAEMPVSELASDSAAASDAEPEIILEGGALSDVPAATPQELAAEQPAAQPENQTSENKGGEN